MSTAEELKQLGNKAFSAGDHETAIKHFTDAIALDPSNHVLYSNRSASHCSLKNFEKALEDAEKCVSIKPDWSKGHGRKGAALFGLKKYQEAKNAYMEGLKIDPDNEQLKKGLSDVHEVGGAEGMNAMFKVFNDPKAIEKLTLNPKTRAFMAQPDFMTKLRAIQANPQSLQAHLGDPRIMQALGVLLGVDLTASEGFGEEPMEEENAFAQEPKKEEPRREEPKKEEPKKEEPKKEEDASTEDSDLPRVTPENKKRASEEKELGNQLYKKKSFQEALQHYQKAWELDPSSIVYLNNMAAVYFEMGNYDECISTCTKAVEEGRNIRADYQLIAKAFGRAGNAYFKKDDMDNAILYFGKSLTEHRTPDILAKLREAEKLRDVRAKEAYINPALAVEAREKGNALFKEQNYSEAVKFYTEATKRDPKDAKNYSNRAAAYNKLMALPEALRDCEEAIRLDPEFVRAHLRKASVLVAMKKFGEALTALEAAKGLDKEGAHSSEVMELEMKCYAGAGSMSEAEVAENARKDPEVAQILSDPVMRSILEQMQSNPKALSEHMKNPAVAKKIQKLMDAGIIRVGR